MTDTITAMRVWSGSHHWQVIGHHADGRIFKATTPNAWMASLWDQACYPVRRKLRVEWDTGPRGKVLEHVAPEPTETHV